MGLGDYNLPTNVPANEYLLFEGAKFSKSKGVGLNMEEYLELGEVAALRYYLTVNMPELKDVEADWDDFVAKNNTELLGNLGNFVNRTLTFTAKRFGTAVPEGGAPGPLEDELVRDLGTAVSAYCGHLDDLQFRKATNALREIWGLGNGYLEKAEPWITIRSDQQRAACSLRTAINLIRIFAVLAAPMIPTASETILAAFGLSAAEGWIDGAAIGAELQALPAGTAFSVPDVLFRKIADDDITAWSERFGGLDLVSGG
jgi:methionyl-tRNA synthetase